jgi:hypothetical protein
MVKMSSSRIYGERERIAIPKTPKIKYISAYR